MEALRYLPYLSDGGWIVTNAAPFVNIPNYPDHTALLDTLRTQPRVILIDADALAKENSVPRAVNMVLLGGCLRSCWGSMRSCWKLLWRIFSLQKEIGS